jgi:hypothetical protein
MPGSAPSRAQRVRAACQRASVATLRPWMVLVAGAFLIVTGVIGGQFEQVVIGAACLGVFPAGQT